MEASLGGKQHGQWAVSARAVGGGQWVANSYDQSRLPRRRWLWTLRTEVCPLCSRLSNAE